MIGAAIFYSVYSLISPYKDAIEKSVVDIVMNGQY